MPRRPVAILSTIVLSFAAAPLVSADQEFVFYFGFGPSCG